MDSWKNVIVHIQAKVPNKVKLELQKNKKQENQYIDEQNVTNAIQVIKRETHSQTAPFFFIKIHKDPVLVE